MSKFIKKATTTAQVEVFVPNVTFNNLPISNRLKENIVKRGFATPTPIQDRVIPHILEGKDVIGIANTGTGKTAAFLIPLLEKVVKNNGENILIIVPTRELALQIRDELRLLADRMNIYSSLCIGGSSIRTQLFELKRNPHFIIGTPGRLKDLVERKALRLSAFNTIVLDEVDRMVDMGFIHDVKYLLSLLPEKRHSLFFSATISSQINDIIHSFLRNPITVSVRSQDTPENVDQDIVRIENGAYKIDILERLLKKNEYQKVLIFGRTKRGVERLSASLYQKGFKVASIHGDKPQSKRQQAIRLFKEDVVNILVATDVAARGIDIANISHVINYDQPATYEDYIHRIGRTGRANQKGYALTFV
ncbi:DEAD/DEAH box helicase [Candidatus Roizmanbacteria bacterium]|nr:DEAD/DEAH box helicase [Candidatus Roizmanbacteria bacterium]